MAGWDAVTKAVRGVPTSIPTNMESAIKIQWSKSGRKTWRQLKKEKQTGEKPRRAWSRLKKRAKLHQLKARPKKKATLGPPPL
mmetsp:Transcript_25631/g.42161  ORF Transcript_25631/g.42161 Transcript_25631/m.42161 type:complete len:83 (+) Transcript_25631:111-359(+)|eukprot:CAMPEP_0184652306 /NCGR_PEP_ID=MMETSP0308-20130426/10005_1 /TAXON_ID=38269 /ORGANISM="Gloeochaete witrockiana, Strain SAG 46.84" /LENGTH=82 /DNA_ID=CAMNT_0027087111 /DNA_START=127 /DNA_END=375 /DNA_ORIENTATION=-